jgi:zinc protease
MGRRVRFGSLLLVCTVLAGGCRSEPGVTATAQEPIDAGTGSSPTTTDDTDSGGADAADAARSPVDLPAFDDGVRVVTLDNGLVVYLRENDRPGLNAEMRLAVNAGSGAEEPDQSGVAHFLEHMLFNGTEKYPKNELIDALRSFGMEFGADVNAYTSYEETVYELSVPLSDEDNLRVGVEILSQWLSAATLDPDQVIGERGVVLDEYRQRDETQDGRSFKVLADMFLTGSSFEGRAPIGEPGAIESMDAEPLQRFYDTWYRPDNAAVVLIGDFELDDAEQLVREYFEPLTADGERAELPDASVRPNSEATVGLNPDPDATSADVELTLPLADDASGDADSSYRRLLADIALQMIANRLSDDVTSGDATFDWSYLSNNDFVRSQDAPSVVVGGAPESLDNSLEALFVEFERADRFGFDANELDRVLSSYRADAQAAYDGRDSVQDADYADRYVEHFLANASTPNAADQFDFTTTVLDSVTATVVANEFARRYDEASAHVFVAFPDTVEGPSQDAVRALIDDVRQRDDIEAREESEPVASELMAPPEPVAELSRERTFSHPEIYVDATELTFANGAKVIINPNDIVDDEVLLYAFSEGGTSLVADADVADALVAVDVVMSSGLGELSQVEVETVVGGSTVDFDPYLDAAGEYFSGTSATGDLELMLQLLHQLVAAANVDAIALDNTVEYYETIAADPLSDPDWATWVALNEARYGAERRYALVPTLDELASVDAEGVSRVWTDRFGRIGDFVIVLAGDVDVETAIDLAQRYVGSLPGAPGAEQAVDVQQDFPLGVTQRTVNAGTGNKGSVVRSYVGLSPMDDRDRVLADLLGSVLDARLTDHIREELGASYSPYASVTITRHPDSLCDVFIEVTGDPTGLQELSTVLDADLVDLATNGPTGEEFETAFAAFEQDYQYLDNWSIATALADEEYKPGRVDGYRNRYDELVGVTAADLAEFTARVLPPGRYIEVLSLPE